MKMKKELKIYFAKKGCQIGFNKYGNFYVSKRIPSLVDEEKIKDENVFFTTDGIERKFFIEFKEIKNEEDILNNIASIVSKIETICVEVKKNCLNI